MKLTPEQRADLRINWSAMTPQEIKDTRRILDSDFNESPRNIIIPENHTNLEPGIYTEEQLAEIMALIAKAIRTGERV